jgi:hypothetical protein
VHELLHQWAAYLDPALQLSAGAHWSSTFNRTMSGFRSDHYNDFELYLMGLLPADSVQPRQIGANGITIDDVITRHAARTPAWPATQNEFTLAAVFVYHRLLTPAELALFDFLVAEFGMAAPRPGRTDPRTFTFVEATGGRARMTTRIPDDVAK